MRTILQEDAHTQRRCTTKQCLLCAPAQAHTKVALINSASQLALLLKAQSCVPNQFCRLVQNPGVPANET